MGNICCRRVGYSPNGTEVDNGRCHQQQVSEPQQPKSPLMSNAYHSAGDDCAINELLEGRMDLDVMLPDGRKVRLTVERRTPMMDLLVQAASATKISPAGHTILVYGDGGKGGATLHYKPSTPIGSLDANTICIVPKKDAQDATGKRAPKMANRPFEPTFRVQVHLPRNQLTVVRVSPRVKISELRNMVCQEKGLDTSRYQLVRPSVHGQPLSGDMTLAEYGSTEITLLSNSCIESHICNSTSHIMPYSKRIEEQKKKTGILRLLAEDANQKAQRKSNGTVLHRPAPTIKITEAPHPGRYKPKKRRPAPPPPPPTLPEPPFHSRQSSSDSSGYHEATSSFLHEEHCVEDKASSDSSGVSSLDAKVTTVQNTKKRKAPPPPPPMESGEKGEEGAPEGGGQLVQMTMDVKIRPTVAEVTTENTKEAKEPESQESVVQLPTTENVPVETEPSNLKESSTERCSKKEGDVVTRVALVALNARIEQDVTQQEIASSIQAAFHSLDSTQKGTGPSLLAIKQRSGRVSASTRPSDEQPLDSATEDRYSDRSSARQPLTLTTEQPLESATGGRFSEPPSSGISRSSAEGLSARQPLTLTTEQPLESATRGRFSEPPSSGISRSSAGLSARQPLTLTSEQPLESATGGRSSESSSTGISISSAGLSARQPLTLEKPLESVISSSSGGTREPSSTGLSQNSGKGQSIKQPPTSSSSGGSTSSELRSVSASGFTKLTEGLSSTPVTKQPTKLTTEQPLERATAASVSQSVRGTESHSAGLTKTSARKPSTLTTEQSSIESASAVVRSIRAAEQPFIQTYAERSGQYLTNLSTEQSSKTATSGGFSSIRASAVPIAESCPSPTDNLQVYPLQKSSARLNFDDGLQAFPPPPSEFRSVETEAVLIDDAPPIPCPPTFRSTPSKTTLRRSSSLLNLTDTTTTRPVAANKSKNTRHLQRSLSDLTVDDKGEFEAEQERLQREYLKLQRQFILWQQQLLSNHAMLREECIVPQYARTLRQSHSLPEGQDYPDDDSTGSPCPLVSRSLSYEPSKCSTLPRSTINIPEFGSGPITNGSSTLRSSKTKSYFKPPQVRVSTKNRQRLPPEIRKDGDLDIYDDTKILSTILPSFDSLKLISEGNDDDLDIGSLILKPTGKVEKKQVVEVVKKVPPPVPNKLATLPKPDLNRQNNEKNRNGLVSGGGVVQPPPPPPLPVVEKSKNTGVGRPNGVPKTVVEKKVITPQVDPREQLMQEIRKCGGRTALRKISLDIAS